MKKNIRKKLHIYLLSSQQNRKEHNQHYQWCISQSTAVMLRIMFIKWLITVLNISKCWNWVMFYSCALLFSPIKLRADVQWDTLVWLIQVENEQWFAILTMHIWMQHITSAVISNDISNPNHRRAMYLYIWICIYLLKIRTVQNNAFMLSRIEFSLLVKIQGMSFTMCTPLNWERTPVESVLIEKRMILLLFTILHWF